MTNRLLCTLISLLACAVAQGGMQPLADDVLSNVQGQDGLELNLSNAGSITAAQFNWCTDSAVGAGSGACTTSVDPYFGFTQLGTVDISGASGSLQANATLDFGSNSQTTVPYAALHADWANMKITAQTLRTSLAGTNSMGSLGVFTTGSLDIANQGGFFNGTNSNALFNLTTQGDVIVRQGPAGSPEFSFGNINFGARFTDALDNVGMTGTATLSPTQGLLVTAPYMTLDVYFDVLFKKNPTDFDLAGRDALILFGWYGGIKNVTLGARGRGIGYGYKTDTTIDPSGTMQFLNYGGQYTGQGGCVGCSSSDGLTITSKWDYNTNFAWLLGQAAGNRTRLRFYGWQRFAGAAYDFSLPIIVDNIQSGQGPGGICFGGSIPVSGSLTSTSCGSAAAPNVLGSFENIAPENNAMAIVIRDGRLHAFNTVTEVIDPGTSTPSETFNWSLLYTFGKLDGNMYFYPGGYGGSATGIKADILVAIQSPGYWRAAQANFDTGVDAGIDTAARTRWGTNTHFMIADTCTSVDINGGGACDRFGIGILNADLLWKTDNMFIRLIGSDPNYAAYALNGVTVPAMPGGLWLHSDTADSYRFRGLFGGGDLANMSNPVRGFLLDVDINTQRFVFALSPAPSGQSYVGFDAVLEFNGNAYLSMAEPSNPAAAFKFGGIAGRLAWRNGRVELKSASATPSDPKPRLTIQNDLQFGSTVFPSLAMASGGPVTNSAFLARVEFGADTFGRVAIPSGQWFSSITLKKQ